MSGIGKDPAETADALDNAGQFAPAELMRDMDRRLMEASSENDHLRKIIAHLLIDVMGVPHHTSWTSEIESQTSRVDVVAVPDAGGDPRTFIRLS